MFVSSRLKGLPSVQAVDSWGLDISDFGEIMDGNGRLGKCTELCVKQFSLEVLCFKSINLFYITCSNTSGIGPRLFIFKT